MANLKDSQGNIIDNLDSLNGLTFIDSRPNTANLGVINAETLLYCAGTNSVAVDVRGTFVGTLLCEYSIDGTNYNALPTFNPVTEAFVVSITAPGSFICHVPTCVKIIRVRMSAYTSGAAIVAVRGSNGDNFLYSKPIPANLSVTTLSTANTTATLTLPSPGAGLYHYIVGVRINRINNSAAAVVGTALLAYTTTNLPGSLAFSTGNALLAGDSKTDIQHDFTVPVKSSAANTASTIVAPAAGAGVQVRMTVFYYIGN